MPPPYALESKTEGASGQTGGPITERKGLGRDAAELLAVPERMCHHDIPLEPLTDPRQGVYDPPGHGTALLAFFAGMAESEREYIREKSLEGQAAAREHSHHSERTKGIDAGVAGYTRTPPPAQNVRA
ncbi:recombinase family protein [Streptomyces sp. NBC_00140]|nr:recombinase family protein [Streptomyces sp. NBC_00140]